MLVQVLLMETRFAIAGRRVQVVSTVVVKPSTGIYLGLLPVFYKAYINIGNRQQRGRVQRIYFNDRGGETLPTGQASLSDC
jgi:hypothetical protein